MNRLILTLSIIFASLASFAQNDIEDSSNYLNVICENYTDWNTVELNGKFSMSGLPIDPSVKIFMEKDNYIRLSLRAPFIGEVGRLEIDHDSVLVVNKMKKVYCKESLSDLLKSMPITIGNIQDMLLARIFLLDKGTLTPDMANDVTCYTSSDTEEYNNIMVVPTEQPTYLAANYGFAVDEDGDLVLLMISVLHNSLIQATVQYDYSRSNTNIDFSILVNDKEKTASLSYNEPKYNGTGFDSFKITSKYTRLSISQFLKAMK